MPSFRTFVQQSHTNLTKRPGTILVRALPNLSSKIILLIVLSRLGPRWLTLFSWCIFVVAVVHILRLALVVHVCYCCTLHAAHVVVKVNVIKQPSKLGRNTITRSGRCHFLLSYLDDDFARTETTGTGSWGLLTK